MIRYFTLDFDREKSQSNPGAWKGGNFSYKSSSSNSTLRHHLENAHKDEYLRLCAENKWLMQLPKTRKEDAAKSMGSNPDSAKSDAPPRPQFSRQHFLHALINFIVADDQVNVFPVPAPSTYQVSPGNKYH
jgi:hypothetical protein